MSKFFKGVYRGLILNFLWIIIISIGEYQLHWSVYTVAGILSGLIGSFSVTDKD